MSKAKVAPKMFENGNHDGLHSRHLKTEEILTPQKYPNISESPKNPELKKIFEELKVIADKMRDENLTSEYEEEWKYAAIVVDRFLSQWVSDIILISEYQRLFSYRRWSLHFLQPFVWELLKIEMTRTLT